MSEVTGWKWGRRVRTEQNDSGMENGHGKDRVFPGVMQSGTHWSVPEKGKREVIWIHLPNQQYVRRDE